MEIKNDFIPIGKVIKMQWKDKNTGTLKSALVTRRSGKKVTHSKICIHNNGNKQSTPKNERDWMLNPNNTRVASWNECINQNGFVIAIPWGEESYHSNTNKGNNESYSIEICEKDFEIVLPVAIKRIAQLIKENNLTINDITTHNAYSGKNCPSLILPIWDSFIEGIKLELSSSEFKPLKLGDVNLKVGELQTMLNKIGYNLVIDNSFGYGTKYAITRFQNKYNLSDYGTVGIETWNKILEQIKLLTSVVEVKMEVLKYGSKGTNVTWLQKLLIKDGFNIVADGDFGKGTKSALIEFQKRYGLSADGIAGANTQNKLKTVEARKFTRNYYNKQTTYFVYPKKDLQTIDIINSKGAKQYSVENVLSMWKRSNMDTVSNGGMYDMNSGATCHYFIDEGVQVGYNAYDPFALLIMKDGTIKFADVSKPVANVKDGIGFSPSLIVNGIEKSWNKNIDKHYITGYDPRHVFMETENYYVEVFVNGRQPLKGWYGCSLAQATAICKDIGNRLDGKNGGCKNAGNCDGGGSCSLALENVEVIKNTNTMRPVDNGIGIKMKK